MIRTLGLSILPNSKPIKIHVHFIDNNRDLDSKFISHFRSKSALINNHGEYTRTQIILHGQAPLARTEEFRDR